MAGRRGGGGGVSKNLLNNVKKKGRKMRHKKNPNNERKTEHKDEKEIQWGKGEDQKGGQINEEGLLSNKLFPRIKTRKVVISLGIRTGGGEIVTRIKKILRDIMSGGL